MRRTIIDEQCSQPSSCLLVAGAVGLAAHAPVGTATGWYQRSGQLIFKLARIYGKNPRVRRAICAFARAGHAHPATAAPFRRPRAGAVFAKFYVRMFASLGGLE